MRVAHYRLCCISELHLWRISLVLGCMQIPWTYLRLLGSNIILHPVSRLSVTVPSTPTTSCLVVWPLLNIWVSLPLVLLHPVFLPSYTSNNTISKWHKSDWKWSQIIPVRGSNLKVLWALRSLYINNIKTSKCGNDLTWTFDLRAMFTFYPTLIPADIKLGLLFWWRQYVFS